MLIHGHEISLPEDKEKKWKAHCTDWIEEAEANNKADNKEVSVLMMLEIFGGKCPKCSLEWRRIEFENSLTAGVYYKPSCRCYYLCSRCWSSLHLDCVSGKLAEKDWFCTNCGFPLNGLAEEIFIKKGKTDYSKRWLKKYIEKYRAP